MELNNFNQPELEKETTTQTAEETEVKKESPYENLPRLEDLLKSENEVNIDVNPQIKGLKQVETSGEVDNKIFLRKEDEKRTHVKHKVKLVTAVYTFVMVFMLGFVIANTVTLANLTKGINSSTETDRAGTQIVQSYLEEEAASGGSNELNISLNVPRDYSDDNTELTFFDKMSILFRSLFG